MVVEPTEELIKRVWPDAYRIAYSVLRDHADAEDAAQEACAQLHAALPSLRDERAFKRWFYRIAVRKTYEAARLVRHHRHVVDTERAEPERPSEQSIDLRRALERLPDSQRLAIIFSYYYGFSDAEVAEILRTTHAAVRVRLFAARRSLRRFLSVPSNPAETEACHE